MMSSVIPARLEYQCGHAALVSLPRIKGESSAQRNERVTREKSAAQTRACDFCGPMVEIVHVAAPPVTVVEPPPAVAPPVVEETVVVQVASASAPAVNGHVVPEPVVAEEQPAVNGHVVPEAVVEEAPKPAAPAPVLTPVKPKVVRRPRTVTSKETEPAKPTPAVNGHVVPEAVVEEAPKPAAPAPVLTPVKPKLVRRPRTVSPKVTEAPQPTPAVAIATRPRVIATAPRAVARKPRVQQPRPVAAAALRQFTISYQVEHELTATDIRDALRQLTSLGATSVIAITRQ